MNFAHMPELNSAWGYPTVMLVIVCVCVGLYVRFKRTRWL
jgi:magnesium transporter